MHIIAPFALRYANLAKEFTADGDRSIDCARFILRDASGCFGAACKTCLRGQSGDGRDFAGFQLLHLHVLDEPDLEMSRL